MNNKYIDRSRIVLKDLRDEDMVIDVLKAQTRRAIEEATAKNLLTEARLNKRLTKLVPGSTEFLKILKNLSDLHKNWEELIELYKETSWSPPEY